MRSPNRMGMAFNTVRSTRTSAPLNYCAAGFVKDRPLRLSDNRFATYGVISTQLLPLTSHVGRSGRHSRIDWPSFSCLSTPAFLHAVSFAALVFDADPKPVAAANTVQSFQKSRNRSGESSEY